MSDYDDILQKKLDALENGHSLESVLADLPAEAHELETLIRLAAAVRTVPHPEPFAAHVAAQREQVMAAARLNTRPIARPAAPPLRTVWNWFGTFGAAGVVGAAAMILVLIVASLGVWLSGRAGSIVQVESVTGQVMVATDRAGKTWQNIEAGYRLNSGQRIRTLGASSATLVFYEGSRTRLEANSDLELSKIKSAGTSLQVELTQHSGETANEVVPLKGGQAFFVVHTPAGTARVHGTVFNVIVGQGGQSLFAVNRGEVRVQKDNSEVTLLSGQATAAGTTGALAEPDYQFSIVGSLISQEPDNWTVSGLVFDVTEQTIRPGDFQIGSTVEVTGRVLEDGTRVADSIAPAVDGNQNASFTGTLQSMEGQDWLVGGTDIRITEQTEIDPALALNDPVSVTFNRLDDSTWLALAVQSLVERTGSPLSAQTASPAPNAAPNYAFAPASAAAGNCGGQTSFNLTGSLTNTATAAKDFAANVELGYLIDSGGEFVSTVELTPERWSRIEAGQTVSFDIHLTAKPEFATAPADAEIELRIFIASATNRPDHLDGGMTVSIAAGCQPTPTPPQPTGTSTASVPTQSQTGIPTMKPTVAAVPAVTAKEGSQCVGADPQPPGMILAQRYGVTYEEIMGWFCQHYGFGEIDLVYALSRRSELTVDEIFAIRNTGRGWGDIKQQVAPEERPQNDDDKGNDQDKDNGKDKDKNKDKPSKNK